MRESVMEITLATRKLVFMQFRVYGNPFARQCILPDIRAHKHTYIHTSVYVVVYERSL